MSGLVVDAFSGVGWGEGLRMLGLREVGIDSDPAVCATRHVVGLATIRADVAACPTWPLAGRLEGLIASPPCQAFSQAGKRLGIKDLPLLYALVDAMRREGRFLDPGEYAWWDDRSPLVLEPLRFVLDCRPAWVALEQAPPVLPLWRRYAHLLIALGYHVWTGVLCAADYGVPQTRERAILMASRERTVAPPEPSHADHRRGGSMLGLAPWVSMAEALGWGWDGPARTVAGHRAPRWAYPAGEGTGRVLRTGSGNGGAHDWERDCAEPAPAVTARGDRWTLHTGRDVRPDGSSQKIPIEEPAPALTGTNIRGWRLVTGANSERGGGDLQRYERPIDQPAPVVDTKAGTIWRIRMGNQDNATHRTVGDGSPTVLCGHRVNDIRWTTERPATTVQGVPRIARPGHRDREGGERQQDGSVRVTLEELAVLQGFPADYPFQGNKSQRAAQIGNAVPPPLAAAIIGAFTVPADVRR